MGFPPCPDSLKAIAHYLKIADEHDSRDIVISYWCRLHALEVGMQVVVDKTPEVNKMLISLMEWLETTKSQHINNEAITSKMCAQATVENYALKLFKYADEQDRAENYGKNVVKAFYTAGILMDVLTAFGDLSEDISEKRKYAKWKAAYIHNCLKAGERPVPGPMENNDENDDFTPVNPNANDEPSTSISHNFPTPPNNINPPPPGGSIPSAWNVFPTPPDVQQPFVNPPPQVVPSTPFAPSPTPAAVVPSPTMPATSAGGAVLNPEQLTKAQKYCKWASSALNYDDVKSAIDNLQKALYLLQTGKESPE